MSRLLVQFLHLIEKEVVVSKAPTTFVIKKATVKLPRKGALFKFVGNITEGKVSNKTFSSL